MNSTLFTLVLAGGSGERFWPISRRNRPKHLLALFGKNTLLEGALGRLREIVPPERTLVLTNREQLEGIRKLAPEIPAENLLAEPVKRDTAAAIALGAAVVSLRDRTATMAVVPADHLVSDGAAFSVAVRAAAATAEATGDLVTIGVKPSWACPGFGYIELGERLPVAGLPKGAPAVYEVERFREKPNTDLAEAFVKQGGFRWNTGIFAWTLPAILSAFERHAPALARFIQSAHETKDLTAHIEARFGKLPNISIDYAVLERASRVLCVEAGFDWDDVGTWAAVANHLAPDAESNRSNAPLTARDASGNVVFVSGKTHVALLGVRDLVVVQAKDALLVTTRDQADRVKNLIGDLPPELQ